MALGWLRWRAWALFGAMGAAAVPLEAWHLATSTVTLHGRRGTW